MRLNRVADANDGVQLSLSTERLRYGGRPFSMVEA
jgi:hypothetical protein